MSSDNEKFKLFVANWDEVYGPRVISHSVSPLFDFENIAINIFMTFQTIFGDATKIRFDRTYITLPFKSFEHIGRILFDVIPDPSTRGGLNPFIVVALVPEGLTDEQSSRFDRILDEIGENFKNSGTLSPDYLNPFISKIQIAYETIYGLESELVEPDENYTLTTAANDMKQAIIFYQEKNFGAALPILRKVHIKFSRENQANLLIEVKFLIGSIYLQIKNYKEAVAYLQDLRDQADTLGHSKYSEQSRYLLGFCFFKSGQLGKAEETLRSFDITSAKFTNRTQYYNLCGQIYGKLKVYDKSITNFEQAYQKTTTLPPSQSKLQLLQQSQIQYDLGVQYYRRALDNVKKEGYGSGLSNEQNLIDLEKSKSFFQSAAELRCKKSESGDCIGIYLLLSQIMGLLKNPDEQIKYLKMAYQSAVYFRNYAQQINIITFIININESRNRHQENIDLIKQVLNTLQNYALIEFSNFAFLHNILGQSYGKLNREEEALEEFIIALTYYKKLRVPAVEERVILEFLINYYKTRNERENLQYYQTQLENYSERVDAIPPKSEPSLGMVKDFWIFSSTGIEIFSHTPGQTFDPALLGGFLTAMQSFSIEFTEERLESFVMANYRYSFYLEPEKEFFVLGRSNIQDSERSVQRILKRLHEIFWKSYEPFLTNFNGDIQPYRSFMEIIREIDFNLLR